MTFKSISSTLIFNVFYQYWAIQKGYASKLDLFIDFRALPT